MGVLFHLNTKKQTKQPKARGVTLEEVSPNRRHGSIVPRVCCPSKARPLWVGEVTAAEQCARAWLPS